MNEKNGSGRWQLIAVIVSVIFGVSGIVVGLVQTEVSYDLQSQANSLSEKNLELQNMISNSTPIIIANPEHSSDYPLNESWPFSNLTADLPIVSTGWLNGSLTVITPHYGNVIVEIINFTAGDYSNDLNPEKVNLTTVTSTLEYNYSTHTNPVIQGLNQLTFNVPLEAMFYLNPQRSATYSLFPLGVMYLEAKLFDAQSQITYTQLFTSLIFEVVQS
jgi:hypothetical protein